MVIVSAGWNDWKMSYFCIYITLCFEIQFPGYYYEIYVFFPKKPLGVEMLVILGVPF